MASLIDAWSATALNIILRPTGWLVILLVAAIPAGAQDFRGSVTDDANGQPIPGAVVTLLDPAGVTLARVVTDGAGGYRITPLGMVRRVRVVRIGYRPAEVAVPPASTAARRSDIRMTAIPTLLEPVRVTSQTNCPQRDDRLTALSLLQQARAGLLAAVVARETNPAIVVRLRFVRQMEGNSDRIAHQQIVVDSSAGITRPYGAVRTGAEFVEHGFFENHGTSVTELGPDAETLIDEGFAAGYCFHLSNPESSRPTEIGLGFVPASRRRGRVDIEGTLWIDTIARSLRDIQFVYVGADRPVGAAQPGGHVNFRQMANGIVLIDRWSLRMNGADPDTSWDRNGTAQIQLKYHVQESGGEVASATWRDGFSWEASLGRLRALVVDNRNNPARGVVVRLGDTDYLASPDATGIVDIPHLLPGPYAVTVVDSALAPFGIAMPTSLRFEADRDSITQRSFSLPRDEEFVRAGCLVSGADASARLEVHVTSRGGQPVGGVNVQISRDGDAPWQVTTESRRTDERGRFESCLLFRGTDPYQVRVWRDGEMPQVFYGRIVSRVNTVSVQIPFLP